MEKCKCPDCEGPYKLWNDYDNCIEFHECGWCHKREKIKNEYRQTNLSKEEEICHVTFCVFAIIFFMVFIYNVITGNY